MLTHSKTKIAAIFNRLSDLPTLPAVVDKLLELSEQDASFKEFAALIGTDPGLTAKVLRLVNSAFYSLKSPVSDLSHACTMIGTRTIKSLVLSVSVMQLFKKRCEGFEVAAFWRHSLAAAMVARRVARSVKMSPELAEEAYIASLLHASGIPLFVQFYPQEYEAVLERVRAGEGNLLELEAEEFGAPHPEAGGKVVTHWRLSPRITRAVQWHATPSGEQPDELDEETLRLIDLVRLADFWACRAGLPYVDAVSVSRDAAAPVPAWTNLDEDEVAEAIGNVLELVSEAEKLFRD